MDSRTTPRTTRQSLRLHQRLRRRLLSRLLVLPLAATLASAAFPGHAAPTRAVANPPVLLVVGDSISAGYGLANGEGWVHLLEQRLVQQGYRYRVVNASISGDTTAGGRARLPALLARDKPAIVVIELGGNDALRGGDLAVTRDNLDAMIRAAQAAGAKVLLAGMQLPPNYGSAYVKRFGALYADLARARHVAAVPFLFEGFAEDLAAFQPDRIHPTAAAQPRILDNVWPALLPLLHRPARG
jgi:acyl-CoA thioesterase-1